MEVDDEQEDIVELDMMIERMVYSKFILSLSLSL